MKVRIYAVFDAKAAVYQGFFFGTTDGVAIRMFTDACRDPGTMLYRHPADFALFHLGQVDDHSGQLDSGKPVWLANASSAVQEKGDGPLFEMLNSASKEELADG